MKILAANWNTVMGLLSLAIVLIYEKWISGLNFLQVNQNETLFWRSVTKVEQ